MSNKLFTHVPVPKFPSSTFSLSRPVLFTPRMKKVYPSNIVEIVPGDGIRAGAEVFARAQPMIAPVFSKIRVRQESWFVPFWQIHDRFDDFITGGERADFTAHMPWIPVSRIYRIVERALYVCWATPSGTGVGGSWFSKPGSDLASNISGYSTWLTRIVDMIDMFDVSRSVPFKMPQFFSPDEVSGQQELDELMSSNYNDFVRLNSHLNSSSLRINLAPFIAYQKVWCEFYRDENLVENYFETIICDTYKLNTVLDSQDSLFLTLVQRLYSPTFSIAQNSILHLWYIFGIKARAWTKDLFTSALPWVQKGPDVLLPLSGEFPVDLYGNYPPSSQAENVVIPNTPVSGKYIPGYSAQQGQAVGLTDLKASVSLDQSGLATTITDFRRAIKLEEFYEADGRGGNRYPENTLMQFGVRTPDSRLPRAQFLGSASQPVTISEVVQNSATTNISPQGNLAGKGTSYGRGSLCRKYFTMHGFWLCFFTIDYGAIYEQGIHPMFSRFDRTEYAWPRFAHLGEQPIYTKQLFVDSTVTEDETFGYGPRYVDYKSDQGSVHGLLKTSFNFWTMARRFSNKPVLNEEFIYSKPRQDAFAVADSIQPPFILEIDYRVRANRKLPFFGVPML